MRWSTDDIGDLTGKVAVITGANGGLGLASAHALAGAGAHVVMAARNQDKARAARDEVVRAHSGASLEIVELDLASQASVLDAGAEIVAAHSRLDIVMCNAGMMAIPKSVTEDGFDTQFAINVLGHWTLLATLLPRIVATPGARVVTLTSFAQHTGRPIDVDDPHMHEAYEPWAMYGQTKLAMRHLAVGLQRRFDQAGVDARAVAAHPGLTNSDLQSTTHSHGGGGVIGAVSERWAALTGMSVERGALSQLRAATDPDAPPGGLYGPLFGTNGPPVAKPLVRPGSDAAIAALWQVATAETNVDLEIDAH
ncbi:MAG: SDR family NAD(P)-dependent oxidoreductase [Acidimicrobiales bacterium]